MVQNWTSGGPPNGQADVANFEGSTVTSLWFSPTISVAEIIFHVGGGSAYTINTSTLLVYGVGIKNESGIKQNFISGRDIDFANEASAGDNTTYTMGGSASDGGSVVFFNSSTASGATITIDGSIHDHDWGGKAEFHDNSTAEDATIAVNGSAFRYCSPGEGCFDNPFPQGVLFIYSSAGNATIIANGGIDGGDGGWISLDSDSTGGTSRLKVFGNGILSISNHNPPGVAIGSLEGDGQVYLSLNTLTVGGNNLSTTFSGVIQDFAPFGGGVAGGSLAKIGSGTMVLIGANTYTGSTTIARGKLVVAGSITSDVSVNSGGTLGGSGMTQRVSVRSGGVVAPGGTQPLHVNGHYTQDAGGLLKIEMNSADPSASGQLDITGDATLGGDLEVRFENGFLPGAEVVLRLLHVEGVLEGSFEQIIFPDLRNGFQFESEVVDGYYQIRAVNDGIAGSGFLNISTRMQVGTGDNALIGGFFVTGSENKRLMLRAIGPSLLAGEEPLPGRLSDPTLELRDSAGVLLFSNDNWTESGQVQEIIDSGIAPSQENESVIIATLAPGSYTAIMRGANDTTGTGLVEVYDLTSDASAKLGNISTRGLVGTGNDVMIGGFIADNQSMHVMVRALGPSLAQSGISNVLSDPTLELHDMQGAMIALNDDWEETNETAIEGTGIAPLDKKESAILTTLPAGAYTAIVRGVNDTTGVTLVEVYDLD